MTAMLAVGPDSAHLWDVVPDPSQMTWGLQDISESDAGRVHDANNTMYKMRTSQKRKLEMTWEELRAPEVGAILRAFNDEYFMVRYFDAMDGQYEVREFYAGDRSAPVRWHEIMDGTRYATLSFNIIER